MTSAGIQTKSHGRAATREKLHGAARLPRPQTAPEFLCSEHPILQQPAGPFVCGKRNRIQFHHVPEPTARTVVVFLANLNLTLRGGKIKL